MKFLSLKQYFLRKALKLNQECQHQDQFGTRAWACCISQNSWKFQWHNKLSIMTLIRTGVIIWVKRIMIMMVHKKFYDGKIIFSKRTYVQWGSSTAATGIEPGSDNILSVSKSHPSSHSNVILIFLLSPIVYYIF